MQASDYLLKSLRSGFNPPYSGSIQDWASRYVDLGPTYAIPGKFDVSLSRYMLEPFDALANYEVRQVNITAAVQSGKSLISEIFVAYTIANNTSNILWLMQTDEIAQKQAESRIGPLLKSIHEIKHMFPTDRHAVKKRTLNLPHCNLFINGAKESVLQSLTIKTLVGDECWLWEDGFLHQAKLRCHAFPDSKKILLISTAGESGRDWHEECNKATVHEWCWTCPACQHTQPYYFTKMRPDNSWAGVIWDKVKKADGTYDYAATAKTARLECYACKHVIHDVPQDRRALNDNGSYLLTQAGPEDNHAYHWNAFAVLNIKWAKLVEDYLRAKQTFKLTGYIEPIKEFYQKILAQSWDEASVRPDVQAAIKQFNPVEVWMEEKIRFLTADVQRDWLYFSVYSWNDRSEVRLLDTGQVPDWNSVREKQLFWKVKDQHVGIDIGFNQTLTATKAVEFGHVGMLGKSKFWFSWIGLKGSDKLYFSHLDKQKQIADKKLYSELWWVDPALGIKASGKRLPCFHWSNPSVKSIAKRFHEGRTGKLIISKQDNDWADQMNSEVITKVVNSRTGQSEWIWKKIKEHNHAWDCFNMSIVMAMIAGIFSETAR